MSNSYGPIRAVAVFFEVGFLRLRTGKKRQNKELIILCLFNEKGMVKYE